MKRLPPCLLVLLLTAAGANAAEPSKPLRALADRLGVPCAVAGAGKTCDLSLVGLRDGKPAAVRTGAAVAWDGQKLRVTVVCTDPVPAHVKVAPVARDGNVWAGEAVEVMLLPGVDHTRPYYQFAVSPAGSIYDARDQEASWNARSAGVATDVVTGAWRVCLTVPAAELLGKGEPTPALWRLNVHRSRPRAAGAPALDVAWSPTHNRSNHVPSRFGLVRLAGVTCDFKAAGAAVDRLLAGRVLLRQTFATDRRPFDAGTVVAGDGPAGGSGRYLRAEGRRGVLLARPVSDLAGLHMALAYRCNADQHGVVVHGTGRPVRAARPGKVTVIGRGLRVARRTCLDADRQTRAWDLGLDAYRFVRPYGHCQQGNMPPTPGREWAVASFDVDDMYTNDGHRRIRPAGQSYEGFRIYLNGKLPAAHWLEIGWVVLWRGRDTRPPTRPSGLATDAKGRLSWSPSKDDVQVSHYELLGRDGKAWKPVTVATANPLAVNPPPGTYALRAVDVAGNASERSDSIDIGAER